MDSVEARPHYDCYCQSCLQFDLRNREAEIDELRAEVERQTDEYDIASGRAAFAEADNTCLRAEVERLRRALEEIRDECNEVSIFEGIVPWEENEAPQERWGDIAKKALGGE